MTALQRELDIERRNGRALGEQVGQLQGEVSKLQDRIIEAVTPETEALARCTRALEELTTTDSAWSVSYQDGGPPPPAATTDTAVGRILLHLAGRFDVPIQAVTGDDF